MTVVNEIGLFSFISLEGSIEAVREQVELVRRPGVNGVGIWKTGRRGRPFTLRSFVDAPTKLIARELYADENQGYVSLIGKDPVLLAWSDLNISGQESVLVAVLDVRQVDCFSIASGRGGLNANPGGFLIADWDLVLISVE